MSQGFAIQENLLASNANNTVVALSVIEVLLIALNDARKSLILTNDTNRTLYVKYGSGVTSASFTYKLSKGDTLIESDYNGAVYGIWDSAGSGDAKISEPIN